jgi:hypothetical protein
MPIFLRPDEIVSAEYKGVGGIFSGSAIALPLGNGRFSECVHIFSLIVDFIL